MGESSGGCSGGGEGGGKCPRNFLIISRECNISHAGPRLITMNLRHRARYVRQNDDVPINHVIDSVRSLYNDHR